MQLAHWLVLLLLLCTGVAESKYYKIQQTITQGTTYDIIIYGATPAGIATALSAATHDPSLLILLLEPNDFIGGMTTGGGIGMRDIGNVSSIVNTTMWNWGVRNAQHYGVKDPVFQADSYVMVETAMAMLSEHSNIFLKMSTNLSETDPVVVSGTTIKAINTLTNGTELQQYVGRVFVDCTYEGDLVKFSGASYTYGREAVSEFNESYAGVLPYSSFANFIPGFPVLATESPNTTDLVDFVDPTPLNPVGSADKRLMSFAYRPCMTTNTSLLAPLFPPPGYNRSDFVLLQRYLDSFIASKERPNGPSVTDFYYTSGYDGYNNHGKNDICANFVSAVNSDDPINGNDFVEATWAERQEIIEKIRYGVLGQFYYLATDSEVPEFTRNQFAQYGYCNDQWAETQHFPPQIYIRTGLRLVGDTIFTQNDAIAGRFVSNSIALGSWKFDMHMVSRTTVQGDDGLLYANNEGALFADVAKEEGGGITYEVPITVLFPKKVEITNLIVPVCVSASHVGLTTLRLEPMYSFLGDVSGIVAAQSIATSGSAQIIVQDINVTSIQATLDARGILYHVNSY